MISITITGRAASGYTTEPLTSGSVGVKTFFSLSPEWDGLGKIAVYKTAKTSVDVLLTGTSCQVPFEALAEANQPLHVGLYGTDAQGQIVIPTVWCSVGKVVPGAKPAGVEPGGVTPEVGQQAVAAAEAAQEAAQEAERIAKSVRDDADNGVFDGADGRDGQDGQDGRDGRDGVDGVDGVSPSATVTKAGSIATIAITDAQGTTTATISDGVDGQDGTPGQDGADGVDGKSAYEIAVEEGYSGTQAEWLASLVGPAGQDGEDGADGVSPSATVSKVGTVSTLTVTDSQGTTSVTISDGQNGQDGQDGSDYILTQQDKEDIADIVVTLLGSADTMNF